MTLFVAGLARALGWLDAGRPDDIFIALLILELSIPPLVVAWQALIRARPPAAGASEL
ncbi:MAG: DUF4345 family protein [Solirubrobacterales bacterium]|nr:DUF4345 family protein [Solirubrobacterales bacterium]